MNIVSQGRGVVDRVVGSGSWGRGGRRVGVADQYHPKLTLGRALFQNIKTTT